MLISWIYILDLLGTLVFAISGVRLALEKKFDLLGSIVIGFVTALGGGTLRDMLIGRTPVGWMQDPNYLYVVLLGCALAYLFKNGIARLPKSMFLFDNIGIGLFTILGIQTTLGIGLDWQIALIMGIVSAVFGGVIRDVLSNEVPLIFRKEIYASACFVGGAVFLLLKRIPIPEEIPIVTSMLIVIVIRYIAVRKGWSLHIRV